MKCEHCGKNEATFFYKSNVNGTITEVHLCPNCAEELGYMKAVRTAPQRMMGSLFGNEFFRDFFSPSFGLPSMGSWFGEDLFDGFFREIPALGVSPAEDTKEKEATKTHSKTETQTAEQPKTDETQNKFSQMRQRNALRMEMKQAVRQENFERAAELRDQLKAMEQNC